MGPHSFKCGKLVQIRGVQVNNSVASMGPHSFKCGKHLDRVDCAISYVSLQWGRTLSSAESGARRRPNEGRRKGASMGPHSYKCGKSTLPFVKG